MQPFSGKSESMTAFVILNKRAGSVSGGKLRQEIVSYFEENGWKADVHLAEGSTLESIIQTGLSSDVDVIVSAGGDGTLRTIAGRLHKKKKPLGIIPLGTINQLARNLNIPINVKGAVETITKGRVAAIDVGFVNGEIFTCNVAIGLFTYAMYAAENVRKQGTFGKIVRMIRLSTMLTRLMLKLPVEYFEINAGNTVIRDKVALVYISNNRFSLGALLTDEEDELTTGTVTLYVPRTTSRKELVKLMIMAFTDKLDRSEHMDVIEHKDITIRMKRRTMMAAVDGEFIALDSPFRFKSSGKSLRVYVPKESRQ